MKRYIKKNILYNINFIIMDLRQNIPLVWYTVPSCANMTSPIDKYGFLICQKIITI